MAEQFAVVAAAWPVTAALLPVGQLAGGPSIDSISSDMVARSRTVGRSWALAALSRSAPTMARGR
jgi:hypothetical protein